MVPLRNANLGATEAADHWMVAFKNVRGQVMVADQYGVRPISELGKIGGRVTNFGVTSRALRVPEAGFVRAMSTLQNGPAVTAMTGGSGGAQWLATSLGVEMVIVNAPTTWNLDAAVRETLGRPPRDWSSITNGNSLAGTGGNGTPGGGLGSGENEIPTPLSPP